MKKIIIISCVFCFRFASKITPRIPSKMIIKSMHEISRAVIMYLFVKDSDKVFSLMWYDNVMRFPFFYNNV